MYKLGREDGMCECGKRRYSIEIGFCIKPRQYETSTYGSTDFRDNWCWESDPFDTGAV